MEKIFQGIKDTFIAISAAKGIIDSLNDNPIFQVIAILGIPGTIIGIYRLVKSLKGKH